ncbi:hypothetical protein B0H14DRAFT_3713011 [Mycena olivaceomarginata]|nr:hypothetical protein B0H14DRAFT_3713011 [Mycena olivaceomarginata]
MSAVCDETLASTYFAPSCFPNNFFTPDDVEHLPGNTVRIDLSHCDGSPPLSPSSQRALEDEIFGSDSSDSAGEDEAEQGMPRSTSSQFGLATRFPTSFHSPSNFSTTRRSLPTLALSCRGRSRTRPIPGRLTSTSSWRTGNSHSDPTFVVSSRKGLSPALPPCSSPSTISPCTARKAALLCPPYPTTRSAKWESRSRSSLWFLLMGGSSVIASSTRWVRWRSTPGMSRTPLRYSVALFGLVIVASFMYRADSVCNPGAAIGLSRAEFVNSLGDSHPDMLAITYWLERLLFNGDVMRRTDLACARLFNTQPVAWFMTVEHDGIHTLIPRVKPGVLEEEPPRRLPCSILHLGHYLAATAF